MKKKTKNNSTRPKVSISLLMVFIASLVLLAIVGSNALEHFKNSANSTQPTPTPNPTISLYKKDNIFAEIEFKDRQIETSSIPEKLKPELVEKADLQRMKCMPEQIYLGRSGYEYSILQNDSQAQKEINLKDEKLLKIISTLQERIPEEYTLSQFIACLTEDERYIVKYNGIVESRANVGYSTQNPVAFVGQILQDGTLQDAAYITLENTFCRTPIQLTKNNMFYLECNSYLGLNGTGEIRERFFYRINLKDLQYTMLTRCVDMEHCE